MPDKADWSEWGGINSHDRQYADLQMAKWKNWSREKKGLPPLPLPAEGRSNSYPKEKVEVKCCICGSSVMRQRFTVERNRKEGKGCMCRSCSSSKAADTYKSKGYGGVQGQA